MKYTILHDIEFRGSKVYRCSFDGRNCLTFFIKTRYHQPNICLHCLQDIGIKDKYAILKIQIYGKRTEILQEGEKEIKENQINENFNPIWATDQETNEEYREISQIV